MTKPLRHRRSEIENAARVARDMGLAVRLEPDGAITLIPGFETGNLDKTIMKRGNPLQKWRERHAGKVSGRA